MVTDNPGTWALECEVNDHLNAGLKATYKVSHCNEHEKPMPSGMKRKFFIGIIETDWDYAESNHDLIGGGKLDDAARFVF